jgi:hypothetical protein
MAETFTPVQTVEALCRFCGKVAPAQLDRSIAANGKTVSREASFEYYCTKCQHSFCYRGTDLAARPSDEGDENEDGKPREYDPSKHYVIGEDIYHPEFEEEGRVVSKEAGTPPRIVVNFSKSGLRKLVEDAE